MQKDEASPGCPDLRSPVPASPAPKPGSLAGASWAGNVPTRTISARRGNSGRAPRLRAHGAAVEVHGRAVGPRSAGAAAPARGEPGHWVDPARSTAPHPGPCERVDPPPTAVRAAALAVTSPTRGSAVAGLWQAPSRGSPARAPPPPSSAPRIPHPGARYAQSSVGSLSHALVPTLRDSLGEIRDLLWSSSPKHSPPKRSFAGNCAWHTKC